MMPSRQRVALTGSSGLIGGALSSSLRADGHEVLHLVRREPRADHERPWDPAGGRLDPQALGDVDTVVHLAGAGIGDKRWTRARKEVLRASRVESTSLVARTIADGAGPRRLVTASAIGIYGDRGDEVLTEHSATADSFIAGLVREWEAASAPAHEAGVPVAHARTGIALSAKGGALTPMLRLGRLGLGGPLAGGRQWIPWITLADVVGGYRRLIDDDGMTGPFNLTAPRPVRQRDLATALGRRLGRPAVLPAPFIGLRVVLGEFAGEAVSSVRVLPHRLERAGFVHRHEELGEALDWLFES